MIVLHEYVIKMLDRLLFGYFDSEDAARAAIAPYADQLVGAWKSLNPIRPDSPLLATLNAPMHRSTRRAGSADIERRASLLLDFDADCASDEMSNASEHEAAIRQAGECRDWLGWHGVMIDSGRGCQFHVPVDLPADASTDGLIANLLRSLKSRFPLIDKKMYDRARLARLPGFFNRKSASPTPDRPWRMAQVLDAGDVGAPVTREQIASVIAKIGLPAISKYSGTEKPDPVAVDRTIRQLAAWLAEIGVDLTEIVPLSDGRTLLRVSHCPLDRTHRGSSAGIGVSIAGQPQRMCQHTSCGMPFPEWRAAVEKQHGIKLHLGGSGRRLIFKKNGATK